MAKKQVIDKEELIEGLKEEERGLISRNDVLSRENREIEKKNAAIQKKMPLIIEETRAETQKLNALKGKAKKIEDELSADRSALNRDKKGTNDGFKTLQTAQDKLREGVEALARGNASLSKNKASIASKDAELTAQINDHKEATAELREAINKVNIQKDIAVKENNRKKEALDALNKERDMVAKSLAGAQDVKAQYLAKKCELSTEENRTRALQATLDKSQKELDILIGDTKRAQKDIVAKNINLDAKLKSHNNTIKAFKIREQEHEIKELRVTKLIRDKKIGADLKKMQEELEK